MGPPFVVFFTMAPFKSDLQAGRLRRSWKPKVEGAPAKHAFFHGPAPIKGQTRKVQAKLLQWQTVFNTAAVLIQENNLGPAALPCGGTRPALWPCGARKSLLPE